MDEKRKTIIFGGIALFLVLLAIITTPRTKTPTAFMDQGEMFYPDFTNPNNAVSLEVVDFDKETGEPIPFKVVFEEGRWRIPSNYNYPADHKERLAKTAAGVIDIRKDEFRTDNPADYEACGVIDPLDETETSLTGRGKRVTIKGKNDKVLADFIIGDKVEGKNGMRFVRIPEKKRVYAVRMDIDISTKFTDWIDSDLLKVDKDSILQVTLKDYSINEQTGQVHQRDVLRLNKTDDEWEANKMSANQEVDDSKMKKLLTGIDELSIVGVRPKPSGLSESLRKVNKEGIKIGQSDLMSLQNKGYYFSRDGQLLSNEGEAQVRTEDGIVYTLRFGEVVYGSEADMSSGSQSDMTQKSGPGENRYLFITTEFDSTQFKKPQKPKDTAFKTKADSLWTDEDHENKERFDAYQEWEEKIEKGKKLSKDLNSRFANWYYIISSDHFKKINVERSELVKRKDEEDESS